MIDVDIMRDASEIVHYDRQEVPLYVRQGTLSLYPEMRALCHWHQDLELIYILSGAMNYSINGETLLLEKGDTLFISSRQMHYGFHHQWQDCRFICVLCHPSLFPGVFERDYLEPISKKAPYLHFQGDEELGQLMEAIFALKSQELPGAELDITGRLLCILAQVFRQTASVPAVQSGQNDLKLQRDIVVFIQQHYAEPLTLDAIAAAGNVSRSKCCKLFRVYLHQTPIGFLNDYRLEVCRNLLGSTDLSVSEIAFSCGFNHLSYFTKLFAQKYGSPPREYRKKIPSEG